MFNLFHGNRRRLALHRTVSGLIALGALSLAAACVAAPIDSAESTVITTSKQMNIAVDGKFSKIGGDVNFDPSKPGAGTATVTIDMSSFDIGADEYNKTLLEKDWFDAKTYPQATFVSSDIASAGPGQLTVLGKLTIKGRTRDVTVPLTVKEEGGAQVFDGVLAIQRLAYGIGENEWKDTSVVANEVDIKFHLVVKP